MEIEEQEQEIFLEPEILSSVISVNGKTGNVVLTTSDLENDSDYQTGADVQSALTEAIGTGTLTVQKNSTTVGTFNANADSDTTINLSVPTKTSELTNDANFQTGNEVSNSIAAHNQSSSAHQDIRQAITDEQNARINADNGLQGQIDAITSASDVVDIVGTYAALEAYDTQHLKDNDVIKVLQDETHNDAMTYYRWSTTTHTWTYIGAEGPYYTKSETNTLLDEKLDVDEVPDGFFDGPATVNPTPATSIEIEDSIKLKSYELQGDTTQQTYSGKNLFSGYTKGINLNPSDGSQTSSSKSACSDYIPLDITGDKSYVISGLPKTLFNFVAAYNSGKEFLGRTGAGAEEERTLTVSSFPSGTPQGSGEIVYIRIPVYENIQVTGTIDDIDNADIQLESGSTPTSYEPYVGSTDTNITPAPNPDYPQDVKIVTNGQTVTINEDEPIVIPLGSVELCKIGTNQDYIYKNGDDWYIHKLVGKKTITSIDNTYNYAGEGYIGCQIQVNEMKSNSRTNGYCNRLTPFNSPSGATIEGITFGANNSLIYIVLKDSRMESSTKANWDTWFSNNETVVYYPLATATDTQITDSSLIAQLEAVLKATLYQPTTTITATGSLPAILNVTAFTDNLNSLLEIASKPTPEPVTYNDFVGTDGVSNGVAGLVPAPTTADAGKFLKADGTWASGGGGGTSYTAGNGINITSDVISVDTTTIQPKLTAGANITIDQNNEISATDTTYTAGTNVNISAQNVISATDTTYSNFVGTDGNTGGTAGLVPAPTTSDTNKYLKSDGTWATVSGGGGPTVVQTTGTSTTDVMSQDAVTSMVYPMLNTYPNTINLRGGSGIDGTTGENAICIGGASFARGERSVSIGQGTANYASGDRAVTIGNFASTGNNSKTVAIGNSAKCTAAYSVALGDSASASRIGEVNVGAGTSGEGYNSTNYRVIGGVHDGQLANDAVTVNQVNSLIDNLNSALNINIPHIGA